MHKKVYELAADCIEYRIDTAIAEAKPRIDSPLEQIFLETLLLVHVLMMRGYPPINQCILHGYDPLFGVKTQFPIGKYRADFMLVSWDARAVVVECDGHDFHERTKEQAAHDRQKDRDVQALGHVILRFTGAEIWADPMKCVGEATAMLFQSPKRIHSAKNFDLQSWMKHGDDYEAIERRQNEEIEKIKAEAKSRAATMSEEEKTSGQAWLKERIESALNESAA